MHCVESNLLKGKNLKDQLSQIDVLKTPHIICKRVENPYDFGVVELDDEKVISVEEKPVNPKSDIVSIGFYFYDSTFFDAFQKIEKSDREEFEITAINQYFIKEEILYYSILDESIFWKDCGTLDRIQECERIKFYG